MKTQISTQNAGDVMTKETAGVEMKRCKSKVIRTNIGIYNVTFHSKLY